MLGISNNTNSPSFGNKIRLVDGWMHTKKHGYIPIKLVKRGKELLGYANQSENVLHYEDSAVGSGWASRSTPADIYYGTPLKDFFNNIKRKKAIKERKKYFETEKEFYRIQKLFKEDPQKIWDMFK